MSSLLTGLTASTGVADGDLFYQVNAAGNAEYKATRLQILTQGTQTATASAQAGLGLTITADPAVAGSSVAGAAAGGNLNLVAGAAARLTSGNANGGNIVVTPGAGIGTGAAGFFQVGWTGGANTLNLQVETSASSRITDSGSTAYVDISGTAVASNVSITTSAAAGFSGPNYSANNSGGNGYIRWTNNASSYDTSLYRLAAGVLSVGTGGAAGNGWIQSPGGCKVLNANATNATNTLANTNLAWTLNAGRSYAIMMKLSGGNSTATEGVQYALTGDGTISATTFDLEVVGTLGTDVAGTQRVTSLGSTITFTTYTQPNDVYLVGYIKVNVGGVLTLQIAENSAHVSGTLTLNAGSWGKFDDMLAV
jgi:hypothetical protein